MGRRKKHIKQLILLLLLENYRHYKNFTELCKVILLWDVATYSRKLYCTI
jgi:hypothetical protein